MATPTSIASRLLRILTGGGLAPDGSGNLYARGLNVVSSDPSPTDGDTWYNSTTSLFKIQILGRILSIPITLDAQPAGSAVTSAVVLTPSIGTTFLPANIFKVGRTIRLQTDALYGASGAAPSLTIMGNLGGAGGVGDGITENLHANTAGRIHMEMTFTCQSTGVSGVIRTGGFIEYETVAGSNVVTIMLGSNLTFDTTSSSSIGAFFKWDTANVANTVTANSEIITMQG